MVVVVIVLGVIAVAALATVAVTRQRLDAQRALTAAAEHHATERVAEVASRTRELEARSTELATAAEERAAASELAAERAEQARLADERATASEAAALAAVEAAAAAEQRALAAETGTPPEQNTAETTTAPDQDPAGTGTPPDQNTAETIAPNQDPAESGSPSEPDAVESATPPEPDTPETPDTTTPPMERDSAEPAIGLDADVVWILERARSERTWRFSVATGPTSESVFEGAGDPLLAALQVELDAAREDVGAIVELDAELPGGLSSAASVLTLRAAQELLADVVRRSEETVLRLRADADDLVIDVESVDENGQPVRPRPLPIPPSPAVTMTETGVRIHHAFTTAPD